MPRVGMASSRRVLQPGWNPDLQGSGVSGLGIGLYGLGVQGLGFRVWGLGFRVLGLGV